MAATFLAVGGARALRLRLAVPFRGCWFATAVLDSEFEEVGSVEVALGELVATGKVDADGTGVFQLSSQVRVVGGLGWRDRVVARHYHSDDPVGVKASTVATTTATECGEVMGTVPTTVIGIDYVRRAAAGARVLDSLFPSWWVDFAGTTHAAARDDLEIAGEHMVLQFNPATKVAVVAVDDPRTIQIGSVLRNRLERPLRVVSLVYDVTPKDFRVHAWGEELAA